MEKEKLKAVALKYSSQEDETPEVIAKGEGKLAEEIISIAKKEGIQVHQDKEVVEFLSKLDIDEEIPPELYEMVAQLLCFVYKMDRKMFL